MSLWSNLQKRERITVALGGGFLLVLLLYSMLIAPLRSNLQQMEESVLLKRAEIKWMQGAADQAKQLAVFQTKKISVSPLKIIDQTARYYGITANLKRVDPGESDKIKVWFEDLAFVDLVKFLRKTGREQRIIISSLAVERLEAPGLVNARITFKTGVK